MASTDFGEAQIIAKTSDKRLSDEEIEIIQRNRGIHRGGRSGWNPVTGELAVGVFYID